MFVKEAYNGPLQGINTEQLLLRVQCMSGNYTAVSYTHLDVYKRQVLGGGKSVVGDCTGEKCNFVNDFSISSILNESDFCLRSLIIEGKRRRASSASSVSYTHLFTTLST